MTIIGIIIFLIIFLLGYFSLDAWHDEIVKKDKDFAVKAASEKITARKKEFNRLSLKYNKRWHFIDSIIKGYVVACITYAFVGFSWWIPIFFFNAFAIRWFWFDLNLNWFSGKIPFYSGSVAKTDTIFKSTGLQITVKIVLILIGIGLIILKYYI